MINKDKVNQGIRYRFPKHETIYQLENMFVSDSETYNGQEIAEAHAAGLYDVNCLRDRWDRVLSPEQIEIERKSVIVFDKSCGNPVMNMLKFTSENYEGGESFFYR